MATSEVLQPSQLYNAAEAILREIRDTAATTTTLPCELGPWLGALYEATDASPCNLLRCNTCHRLVLANRATAHLQHCDASSNTNMRGPAQEKAVVKKKEVISKPVNRRLSDAGLGPKVSKQTNSSDMELARPTKLSKVTYPEPGAKVAQPVIPKPIVAGHVEYLPFGYIPLKRRSQQRKRKRTHINISWMLMPVPINHHVTSNGHYNSKASNGKASLQPHNPAPAPNKKIKLSIGGSTTKQSKVKMLDGLASHGCQAIPLPGSTRPKASTNTTSNGQQTGGTKPAGLTAKPLRGAALKSHLAKAAANAGLLPPSNDSHSTRSVANTSSSQRHQQYHQPHQDYSGLAGLQSELQASQHVTSPVHQVPDSNSYLAAQKALQAEFAQRMSQRPTASNNSKQTANTVAGGSITAQQAQHHHHHHHHQTAGTAMSMQRQLSTPGLGPVGLPDSQVAMAGPLGMAAASQHLMMANYMAQQAPHIQAQQVQAAALRQAQLAAVQAQQHAAVHKQAALPIAASTTPAAQTHTNTTASASTMIPVPGMIPTAATMGSRPPAATLPMHVPTNTFNHSMLGTGHTHLNTPGMLPMLPRMGLQPHSLQPPVASPLAGLIPLQQPHGIPGLGSYHAPALPYMSAMAGWPNGLGVSQYNTPAAPTHRT